MNFSDFSHDVTAVYQDKKLGNNPVLEFIGHQIAPKAPKCAWNDAKFYGEMKRDMDFDILHEFTA